MSNTAPPNVSGGRLPHIDGGGRRQQLHTRTAPFDSVWTDVGRNESSRLSAKYTVTCHAMKMITAQVSTARFCDYRALHNPAATATCSRVRQLRHLDISSPLS
ncbi:hypothetical protein PV04_09180 [Phialophora macrospora]|uniref:Uncharacterized protein n=1 Tax=Phialophora macrospora TaxID=1851006 RepID=A0A0D2FBI7_9EURO|nr:hypothetical protein PV04_09180 [Phialophora macrospora]